jgi:hypothetical protein
MVGQRIVLIGCFLAALISVSFADLSTAIANIDGYTARTTFGYSVSMYGDYAIVGAPVATKAFIFKKDATGTWGTPQ